MTASSGPVQLQPGSRIVIVMLGGLGDAVHALPLVNAIRRAVPDARITCVDRPVPASLFAAHPAVDRALALRAKSGLGDLLALARELGVERCDVTVNLSTYFKGAVVTVLSRAPERIGFRRGIARDGAWLSCNHHTVSQQRRHTQDLFLEFLDVLGITHEPIEWRLEPSEAERDEQAAFFAPYAGRTIAAVVPASSKPQKDWAPERWIELVDRLDREFGITVMLVGGPGRRETALARMIAETSGTDVIWAMEDGVRRLIWRIAQAKLVIAPDTAAIHIARALGVPAIGLYGHTNPWRVGPWQAYQELWIDRYTEPGEAPDPRSFDPKHGRMERITTGDVIEKVRLALARYAVP